MLHLQLSPEKHKIKPCLGQTTLRILHQILLPFERWLANSKAEGTQEDGWYSEKTGTMS